MNSKPQQLDAGIKLVVRFCVLNSLPVPSIEVCHVSGWRFDACAYYRKNHVTICPARCAQIGTAGACWSFPGYIIDRTPYGVMAHEIGHHADFSAASSASMQGKYWSNFSKCIRRLSREEKLTGYCANDCEWFAEMFRLFITNPDLLRCIRPKTFELLALFYSPVETRTWREVLAEAPPRTLARAAKLVSEK